MNDSNKGCYGSDGCDGCDGCNSCNGCNGCYSCYGCDDCYGCDGCNGCYSCYGCDGCYGLRRCKAVYKSLFSVDQVEAKFLLFNKQVTEERIDEVKSKFRVITDYWYPKQTNAFELYLKNGSDWSKIPVQDLVRKSWADSWKDMPQAGIDYLASLPEFDEKIFKEVTGIEGGGLN